MKRFVEGEDRTQSTLFPERLDEYIAEDNPVRVIDVYGYLNRVQSSRRLERETQRNVEMMWLTGRLMPDFKTIADFRKDNSRGIRRVCSEFIEL
jgi:transposase